MKIPKFEKKRLRSLKKTAKILGKRGFTSGSRSSASHKLNQDRYQITPQGIHLRKIKKKMIVTVDSIGNKIFSRYGWHPADDLELHLAAYQARGDINSAIHAHPPYLSALAMGVDKLDAGHLPESLQILGKSIVVNEIDWGYGETPIELTNALSNGNVILLPGDGVFVVSNSIEMALTQLEQMEHDAMVYTLAQCAGVIQSGS